MLTNLHGLHKDKIVSILTDYALLYDEGEKSQPNWAELRQKTASVEVISVIDLIISGTAFIDAILATLQSASSLLRKLLFGPMDSTAVYDPSKSSITVSDGCHRLVARFGSTEKLAASAHDFVGQLNTTSEFNLVLLETDFRLFNFRWIAKTKSVPEPFLKLDITSAASEISLVGSLWSCIFPSHHAIITRTIAFSVSRTTSASLFDHFNLSPRIWLKHLKAGQAVRREYRALERLKEMFDGVPKQGLDGRHLSLITLDEVRSRLRQYAIKADLLSETIRGELVVRRYLPPHSKIFCFDEEHQSLNPSRPDYVISHAPGSSKLEFHRDFLVSLDEWTKEEVELYRATLDVLHVMAVRRSGLLRLGFAQRVFTIVFPPLVMEMQENPNCGIFLLPCAILYQVPWRSTFRRTFTISYVAVPIHLEASDPQRPKSLTRRVGEPRRANIDELRAIQADLKAPMVQDELESKGPKIASVAGPLAELIGLSRSPKSIRVITEEITVALVSRILNPDDPEQATGITRSMTFSASMESRLATILMQVEWNTPAGDSQPWERWLTTGEDNSLKDNIYKLMFYEDFLNPQSGYTSRSGVDLKTMMVGNNLRTDMNGMTFFDPTSEHKIIIYPRQREQYPNYSIVRWMAFSLYAESALSALQGLIHRFYLDLNQQVDLRRIVDTLEDMIESFAELYDLDIRQYLYRQEYEKLRQLLKVDRDYEFFMNKFSSVKEEASLREQRLFNKLLMAFAVSSASVAIVGTMAQITRWTSWTIIEYVVITLVVAVGLAVGAFVVFDRVRKLFS